MSSYFLSLFVTGRARAKRLIRAIKEAGLSYTATRLARALRNQAMERLSIWRRIDNRIDVRLANANYDSFGSILHPDGVAALNKLIATEPGLRTDLLNRADQILCRNFSIFGEPVPKSGNWPWHADWVHGKSWPAAPVSKINIYEPRDIHYDLKFPLELSRLAFLPQVALAALLGNIEQRKAYFKFIEETISDWLYRNPTAGSVVWYSFEGSVRGVFATQTLSLLKAANAPSTLQLLLAQLLARCGHFTRYYPDKAVVPNNHYIGNLVGLVTAGHMLRETLPEAEGWLQYAKPRLEKEILRQFHKDGGHFEGSIPYHVATTELCLIAECALEAAGEPLLQTAKRRLRLAGAFADATADLRGVTPPIGDCDDSRYLVLDLADQVIAGNVALVADTATRHVKASSAISCAMLRGSIPAKLSEKPETDGLLFPNTGIAVIRTASAFFLQDVGPVGMLGRGGHGHNDLGSFVLQFDGAPLISDRGTSSYSAGRTKRDLARSGHSHSLLILDGNDIARMGASEFEILNDALPSEVALIEKNRVWHTTVCHGGFGRIYPGLLIRREIHLDPERRLILCSDMPSKPLGSEYERRFQLDVSLELLGFVGQSSLSIRDANGSLWLCTWDDDGQAALEDCIDYQSYGMPRPAICLVIRNKVPVNKMWFRIARP